MVLAPSLTVEFSLIPIQKSSSKVNTPLCLLAPYVLVLLCFSNSRSVYAHWTTYILVSVSHCRVRNVDVAC
ncbi:hypothetical protein P167DRAFT_356717 [Morchella conica CCBAS932]|uniref:Uncharacterized protein n=1 Tax=Morchella conica CCBAS932 TaxID=1392247 RepID=A0A3N4KFZ7_9PEZI|nr:hypothetical protein P167DRAFT_356717 [Morchella conica CCBAS932]